MLEEIKEHMKERMEPYTDSRQPTGDEVRICWLVTEVERLMEENNELKLDISGLEDSLRNAQSY